MRILVELIQKSLEVTWMMNHHPQRLRIHSLLTHLQLHLIPPHPPPQSHHPMAS